MRAWRRMSSVSSMLLELSNQDADELSRVLSDYLTDFRDEILHTDDRELRAEQQSSYERLMELKLRIDVLRSVPGPAHI